MAGLRFRGTSADALGITFMREGRTTSKRALRQMRRVSKNVMETSVKFSPVDYHGPGGVGTVPAKELERAHKVVEQTGLSNRIEATVEVGGIVDGINVDLYAEWQHNGGDGGPYTRGPGTVAKGPDAGPFFLERALQENETEFEDFLDELFDGLMS